MSRTNKAAEMEERQIKVSRLLLQGKTQRQIAKELGVSQRTVSNDVQAVRAEWRDRRVDLIETKAMEDLARTDVALHAIQAAIEAGNEWKIDRLMNVLDYRAKVLGLYDKRETIDIGDTLAKMLQHIGSGANSNDPPGDTDAG